MQLQTACPNMRTWIHVAAHGHTLRDSRSNSRWFRTLAKHISTKIEFNKKNIDLHAFVVFWLSCQKLSRIAGKWAEAPETYKMKTTSQMRNLECLISLGISWRLYPYDVREKNEWEVSYSIIVCDADTPYSLNLPKKPVHWGESQLYLFFFHLTPHKRFRTSPNN